MSTDKPRYGHVHGLPVHLLNRHYLPNRTALQRFNSRLMVSVTAKVGTSTCAYLFCLIALVSLPATLTQAGFAHKGVFPSWLVGQGLIGLIQWITQTFIQLVLLAIILCGQNIQAAAGEARSAKQFQDTETILDRMDENTAGGIQTVLEKIEDLRVLVTGKTPAATGTVANQEP